MALPPTVLQKAIPQNSHQKISLLFICQTTTFVELKSKNHQNYQIHSPTSSDRRFLPHTPSSNNRVPALFSDRRFTRLGFPHARNTYVPALPFHLHDMYIHTYVRQRIPASMDVCMYVCKMGWVQGSVNEKDCRSGLCSVHYTTLHLWGRGGEGISQRFWVNVYYLHKARYLPYLNLLSPI